MAVTCALALVGKRERVADPLHPAKSAGRACIHIRRNKHCLDILIGGGQADGPHVAASAPFDAHAIAGAIRTYLPIG